MEIGRDVEKESLVFLENELFFYYIWIKIGVIWFSSFSRVIGFGSNPMGSFKKLKKKKTKTNLQTREIKRERERGHMAMQWSRMELGNGLGFIAWSSRNRTT